MIGLSLRGDDFGPRLDFIENLRQFRPGFLNGDCLLELFPSDHSFRRTSSLASSRERRAMQCSTFPRQIHPSQAGQSLRVGLTILIAWTARPECTAQVSGEPMGVSHLLECGGSTPPSIELKHRPSKSKNRPHESRLIDRRFWTIDIFIPNDWRAASSRSTPGKGRDRHVVGLVVKPVAGRSLSQTYDFGDPMVAPIRFFNLSRNSSGAVQTMWFRCRMSKCAFVMSSSRQV